MRTAALVLWLSCATWSCAAAREPVDYSFSASGVRDESNPSAPTRPNYAPGRTALELRPVHTVDAGWPVAIRADASIESAETAWMISHIGDSPDRANSADSPNVRALALRGVDGIRAVIPLFARGDGNRVRFARRVIERVAVRTCRGPERPLVPRMVMFIELGGVEPTSAPPDMIIWSRADDRPWPADALDRLRNWVERGLPCDPDAFRDALNDIVRVDASSDIATSNSATTVAMDASTRMDATVR